MRLMIVAVGRMKAGPERDLAERYGARAAASARNAGLAGFDLREVDEGRGRHADERKAEEARAIAAALPRGALAVALDEQGEAATSVALAARIGRARDAATPAFVLIVGGPDGLDTGLRGSCATTLAFGAMTWPHQLVRIMAAEQLYRAVTILSGHPYHRA